MKILEWLCVLLGAAWIFLNIAVPVGIVWAVCHFISKWW